MPPISPISTWNQRRTPTLRATKGKCFFVAEGANTEFWYLKSLARRLAKQDLPRLVEMVPVERTGSDQNKSHPRSLVRQAKEIRDDPDSRFGFDPASDRVVIVFDADVYRQDNEAYLGDLSEIESVAQAAVTNPSFELFLLLHKPGSLNADILPHERKILENAHYPGGRRRYISGLASEALGVNLKKNFGAVAALADDFRNAIAQEALLNQDPALAMGRLTSNVALVIKSLIEEDFPDGPASPSVPHSPEAGQERGAGKGSS